jgi:hypothetical protein
MQSNDDSSKNERYIQQILRCYEDKDKEEMRSSLTIFLSTDQRDQIEVLFRRLNSTIGRENKEVYEEIKRVYKKFGLKHPDDPDSPQHQKLLKFWELFSFVLPLKTRREAYEPAYNDLLANFLKASRLATSKSAKRWLQFCFGCQTLYMVADCFRVWIGSKLRRLIWDSVLESFRKISGG